jgi:shikimate dehydrogenase|uniref:Shikimate dehydrogenase (NADP(+)) n=1 Tax=Acidicaldus sp. TaxID=1872105 RepID=A0A8J4M640_9PROT
MTILTGNARLAGVVGWPVGHSRSPRLHGFWLERHGIDGAYVPLAVAAEEFATAILGLSAAGFAGLNVTLPHKQAAFALCDVIEPSARRAGAVNTLVFRAGRIIGSNTDGAGFLAHLAARGVDPLAGPALVLGAGGAARAIAAALLDAGARVSVTARRAPAASALAAALPGIVPLNWDSRAAALADHALVINTTTAGMAGQPPLALDLTQAAPRLVVADIVYTPLRTPLLAAAEAAGLRAVDGLGMLLHQAVPGFAAWFGVTPTVDAELYRFVAADLPA